MVKKRTALIGVFVFMGLILYISARLLFEPEISCEPKVIRVDLTEEVIQEEEEPVLSEETLSDTVTPFSYSDSELYSQVGTLSFDALGIYDAPVYLGSDTKALKLGICMTESAGGWQYPGESGRVNLSCHNYGAFKPLTSCSEGDFVGETLELSYKGECYRYKVIASGLVLYDDWAEKAYYATPEGGVTISTCWPITKPGTKDSWVLNCEPVK